jgi:hypothetical protein
MRRIISIAAVGVTAVVVTAVGGAQTPTETPFPSPTVVQFFVSTETVTNAGELSNFFPRGSTVVFRAFAGQAKTGKILTGDDTRYFYVSLPGQPNVKLTYTPSKAKVLPAWLWKATWTVPADYPLGLVQFKVLLRTKGPAQFGSFVQIPVGSSQLTVTKA